MQARSASLSLTGSVVGGGQHSWFRRVLNTNELTVVGGTICHTLLENNADRRVLPVEWHATVCTTYSTQCVALDVLVLSTPCVCELSMDYSQTVCRTVCGLFFSDEMSSIQQILSN